MNWLRKQWRRVTLRGMGAMERVYLVRDPWGMEGNPHERYRFGETAIIIRELMQDKVGSILEMGCGEGAQSFYLAPLCGRFVGVDPSSLAIERAKRREIPNASFLVGSIGNGAFGSEMFDLVTACEVLYYLDDVRMAISWLERMGRTRVVTYHEGKAGQLDRFFAGKATRLIERDGVRWKLVYW